VHLRAWAAGQASARACAACVHHARARAVRCACAASTHLERLAVQLRAQLALPPVSTPDWYARSHPGHSVIEW
jgi:hypothetical protein